MRNGLRSVQALRHGGRRPGRKSMLRLLPFSCSMPAERTALAGRGSTLDAPLGRWETVERWR